MALDVLASTRIDRSPEVVAAYQFDPTNDSSWIGGVNRVERLTDGPMRVGSRVRRLGGFMGRPIEWVMDVVDYQANRRLAMHAIRSPFPMDVTYELAPDGRGTAATIRVQGETRGMYGLMGPLTPIMVRRSVQSDLERLKKAVETHPR